VAPSLRQRLRLDIGARQPKGNAVLDRRRAAPLLGCADEWQTETVVPPEDIQAALSGGVPLGRWQEGLLFEGINPTPGLSSASNWFPRTEEVAPDELRITFMGTAPFIRPGQMNTSILIELGNGDNFVFDIGEGSVANYVAAGKALNAEHDVSESFVGWVHTIDHPVDVDALVAAVADMPRSVYRIKGFVSSATEPEHRVVLQAIGRRADVYCGDAWGDDQPITELVVVAGRANVKRDEIDAQLDACVADAATHSPA
jgi:hypothetical protein